MTASSLAPVRTDSLGCALAGLALDQELVGGDARFFRKRRTAASLAQVATPASARGHLLGVSLQPGHRRRIFDGPRAATHAFDAGTIYLRDFADDYRADIDGGFDFLLMELPPGLLDRLGDTRVNTLEAVTARPDPVLFHLAHAVAAAMQRPADASRLFVDQMGTAIAMHVVARHGRIASRTRPAGRRLSPLHENRAKEMLRHALDGRIAVAEIADACSLSRSHFLRAFRETTGQTPLQWLIAQRLATARGLLRDTDRPLADIAATCGFADQSHFTREFARVEGRPPGQWRRQLR